MNNPVVHFEMSYKDKERVSAFYEQAFGWKMNQLGAQMGEYIVAHTAETDENGMVKTPGAINGGFYDVKMSPQGGTSVVISVEDINAAIEKIKSAGGEMVTEPAEIPGIGMFATFKDTEGNRVSILQPKKVGRTAQNQ